MKIGLYGGSFDPIHYGHIQPVLETREALALDQIIYLPTANPPHKPRRDGASALARYAMVELALLAEPRLVVSTFELGAEVAYTVETLEHFKRLRPESQLFFLLGRDSLAQLESWRRWRDILDLADLAVLERPGIEEKPLSLSLQQALEPSRVHHITNTPVLASSTEIRRRLAAHSQDLHQWVPPLVLDYIDKYELYR